jgi:hypothetical protein
MASGISLRSLRISLRALRFEAFTREQRTAFNRRVREKNSAKDAKKSCENGFWNFFGIFADVFACSAVQGFYDQQLLTAEFAKKIRRGRGEGQREWLLAFLCDLCGCPLRALRFKAFTGQTLTALRWAGFCLDARTLRPALPRRLSTQQMPYRPPSAGRHPLAAAETGKNSRW